MTQAEYARYRGVTQGAVTQAKTSGRLVMRDGMVDAKASDAILNSSPYAKSGLKVMKPKAAVDADSEDGDITAVKRGRGRPRKQVEPAESQLAELLARAELARRKETVAKLREEKRQKRAKRLQTEGRLVAADEVEAEYEALAMAERDALLALPAKECHGMASRLGVDVMSLKRELDAMLIAHIRERQACL